MTGLAPGTPAEADTVRIAAIKELLNRAYGRATQPLSGDGSAEPSLIDIRRADATPRREPVDMVGAECLRRVAVHQ